jgi:23S rRNA (cytidine1920-2'-O)/16S rRNA (cytidine1409-2'-O)-methyltransferase
MTKTRLDILLFERGLVESRSLAQRLVMAGQVRVAGQLVLKPATRFDPAVEIVVDHGPRFVSRGGDKLQAALEAFGIDARERDCADVGASTGGFTDCLLQAGARRVYAIDVGKGILDWNLRQDPRVVVMEGTNARFVEHLPEAVSLVTMDASFISITLLLPSIKDWFAAAGGEAVALIKPQFEAGRDEVQRGKGVIRDAAVHQRVLYEVLSAAQQEGFGVAGLIASPLLGPKGNREFLAWLVFPAPAALPALDALITSALLPPAALEGES